MQLPSYEFLSAPLWLITVLHILTLTLHFAAMNFIVGGLVAVLWGRFTKRWENPVVQRFIKLFPTMMAVTVTTGVAPLLFLQLVYHRQVYSASIVSGWFWLMIIPAVIIGYYCLYGAAFSKQLPKNGGIFLTLSLLAVLYVSFVYSSVFALAERPDVIQSSYTLSQAGDVILPSHSETWFRWLHMITGAITVGSFFVGLLGRDNDKAFNVGRQFFLWGMAVASLFGFLYLVSLGDFLVPFMRSPGIWVLTLGIVLAFGSLHFFFKKKLLPSAVLLFVSLLSMVTARHYVRLLRLEESFDPSTIAIEPQWSPFIMFLICFVIAIAVVWYMLRLFFTDNRKPA